MEKQAWKAFVLAVGIAAIMSIAGCNEENLSGTNAKKSRLIADENWQLKEQLEQKNREVEKHKQLLDKCAQEKNALQEQIRGKIDDKVSEVLDIFSETLKPLQEENEELKAQIEKLQKELQELKNPSSSTPM
jgi:DNA anti-recombination protein RmuC